MDRWGFELASAAVLERARDVQWIVTDCDGCLTDGGVYYGEQREAFKRFSIVDGMGVTRLHAAGAGVAIVTGEKSPSIAARARKLRIEELHLGIDDKAACLEAFRKRCGLEPAQVAYFADDVNDLCVLPHVGLLGAPANALPFVKEVVHWTSPRGGGHGAFRDFAELILRGRR